MFYTNPGYVHFFLGKNCVFCTTNYFCPYLYFFTTYKLNFFIGTSFVDIWAGVNYVGLSLVSTENESRHASHVVLNFAEFLSVCGVWCCISLKNWSVVDDSLKMVHLRMEFVGISPLVLLDQLHFITNQTNVNCNFFTWTLCFGIVCDDFSSYDHEFCYFHCSI